MRVNASSNPQRILPANHKRVMKRLCKAISESKGPVYWTNSHLPQSPKVKQAKYLALTEQIQLTLEDGRIMLTPQARFHDESGKEITVSRELNLTK